MRILKKIQIFIIMVIIYSVYTLSADTWLKKLEFPLGEGILILNENELIFSGWKEDSKGFYDLILTKISILGEPSWSKLYGDVGHERTARLLRGQTGYLFLLGSTDSFGSGDLDLWVAKITEEGDIVWQERYATGTNESPGLNAVLYDCNLLSAYNVTPSFEFVVVKIESQSGEILWQRRYSGSSYGLMGITEDQLGDLYFALISDDHTSFILKTSSKGDILWQKKLSYAKELWLGDIKAIEDKIILTARISDESARMALMEIDEEGNILSKKAYTPPFPSCGLPKLNFTSNGNILLSNSVRLTKNGNDWNSWLLQLDSNWNIVWEKQYNIENNGDFFEIKEYDDNSYIGIGSTYTNFYRTDGLLCKLNKEGSISFYCPLEKEISSSVFEDFNPKIENVSKYTMTNYDLVAFDTFVQPKDAIVTLTDLCSPSCPTIDISPSSLPSGRSGESYSAVLTASGGSAPYKFSISSGKLPNGLSLSDSGTISGTPSEGGDFTFSVTALDASNCAGKRDYTLFIDIQPPTISSVSKLSDPFRLKVSGSNFHSDLKVYIGGDENAWTNVKYKSSSQIVLKGGSALKAKFPKGVPVEIKIVNGDGGEATFTYKR